VIAVPRIDGAAVRFDRTRHRSLLDAAVIRRADTAKGRSCKPSVPRFIARPQA